MRIYNVCTFESHPRQLIFLRKSDCLGSTVLLCLVCLTLLTSFFLPSHLSLKHNYNVYYAHVLVCEYVHVCAAVSDLTRQYKTMQSEKDSHIQYLEAQVRRLQDKLGQCMCVYVHVYVCMYYQEHMSRRRRQGASNYVERHLHLCALALSV